MSTTRSPAWEQRVSRMRPPAAPVYPGQPGSGPVRHDTAGIDIGGHVGDHLLYHLKGDNRRVKLNPFHGILKGNVKGPLCNADGADRIDDPFPVQSFINNPNTLVSTPNTFEAGTTQSSKISSPEGDPRTPIFFRDFPRENPGKSFSTTKAVIPLCPASGFVFAYTTMTSARGPLVMNIFVPLRTYESPLLSALVVIDRASEPAPGSVMAMAPIVFPAIRLGRYLLLCSSLPFR